MAVVETKDSTLLSRWQAVAARCEELNAQLVDQAVLSQPAVLRKLAQRPIKNYSANSTRPGPS